METLVNLTRKSLEFGEEYFPTADNPCDDFYLMTGEFEGTILRATYPELKEVQCKKIEEMLLKDGVTAQEILEEMGLDDREEEMQEQWKTVSEIDRNKWGRYVVDRRLEYVLPGAIDQYYGIKDLRDHITRDWDSVKIV